MRGKRLIDARISIGTTIAEQGLSWWHAVVETKDNVQNSMNVDTDRLDMNGMWSGLGVAMAPRLTEPGH